jgi:hypothetical protein
MKLPTGVRASHKGRYRATIMVNGQRHNLGTSFMSAEEAGEAYRMAREHFPKKTGFNSVGRPKKKR